ncbi:hypothetical protein LUZ62_090596 [Rhynchospora pubera]|uniref:Knr4/Smi1-like domain-containing protein n=1 Tax=Rhynchospora pubera TaxID=906938 RepID=A0AAV8CP46_9POAL|nr:hypothetical protein LUZ62_090596 [Rhynchospora pubera]
MVDVAQRTATLPPPHPTPAPLRRLSGLRRLSVRASSASPSTPSRTAVSSFAELASSILSHLSLSSVQIEPGLSDSDLVRIESELSITFPPDLRTLLSLGLPSGTGFPNWRHRPLHPILNLPLKKIPLVGHSPLGKAPRLIPVYKNCYIPALPCLAGNPVFRVDEDSVSIAGVDLADFFSRETGFLAPPAATSLRRQMSASLPPLYPSTASTSTSRRSLDSMAGKTPRWIEFWTDATSTTNRRRRINASISNNNNVFRDHELVIEMKSGENEKLPSWVSIYLDEISSMLRSGGWCESDVKEMVHVAASDVGVSCDGKMDGQDTLDKLFKKTDRCSDSLRRAGWNSDEVLELLRFDGLDRKQQPVRRPQVRLPPKIPLAVIRPV